MFAAILTVLATVIGTAGSMYIGVIRPRENKRKKDAQATAKKQELHDQVLDGVQPIPGMTEGQLAIAVRVQATEKGLKEVKDELMENTAAVSTMSLRQRQQNGDVREMKGMVNALIVAVQELLGRPISPTPEETRAAAESHTQENTANTNTILTAIESERKT